MSEYKVKVPVIWTNSNLSPRELATKLRELIVKEFFKTADINTIVEKAKESKNFKKSFKPKIKTEIYEKFKSWKDETDQINSLPDIRVLSALLAIYVENSVREEMKNETVKAPNDNITNDEEEIVKQYLGQAFIERVEELENKISAINRENRMKTNDWLDSIEELKSLYYEVLEKITDIERELTKMKMDYELFKESVMKILKILDKT